MTTLPKFTFPEMKRWTVAEYHGLRDQGFLHDGDPIELIDGLLVYKDRRDSGGDPMTVGERHIVAVRKLARLDRQVEPYGCFAQTQLPVLLLGTHEPEPDACVLSGSPDDASKALVTEADIVLIIEVADSSLENDRAVKQRVYATAGIPVYWIVNLRHNTVEVYEQPDAQSGEYRIRRDLVPGESATIALPGGQTVFVPVSDLVG